MSNDETIPNAPRLLSVVVPVHDEQENLEELVRRLTAVLDDLPGRVEAFDALEAGRLEPTAHLVHLFLEGRHGATC